MDNIKRRFESESKTRINLVGPSKCGKSTLALKLIKDGIFDYSICNDKNIDDIRTIFSTEILCTGPRSNEVMLYLSLKDKKYLLNNLKDSILNNLDEAFVNVINDTESDTVNNKRNKQNKFFDAFKEEMRNNYEIPLNRFFAKNSLRQVFAHVNFEMLFEELNKENSEETLEKHDDIIWNKYFSGFVEDYNCKYTEWLEKMNKYYAHSEDGCRYINNLDYTKGTFENDELKAIEKILYGINESCGLMVDRVYIEAPGRDNIYSQIVFVDYYSDNFSNNIVEDIESRVGKDYKELFIVIGDCNKFTDYISNIKSSLNKVTLDKRIFCILNKFDIYLKNLNMNCSNVTQNVLEEIKEKAANTFKLNKNKIIITENFSDIDKASLKALNSNNEFLRLLKLIKYESNKIYKNIKIRNPSRVDNIISIKLNQERMSVQALVNMLYEKYNDYLLNLWRDIKRGMEEYKHQNTKQYYVNTTRTLIRRRKKYYKGYKCKFSNDFVVDFSMRSGEKNEAKKILKMLLNYGYKTVGFNSNENKIVIKVNGEISREDRMKLINSIKGRLEESAITYFENAFLTTVTNKKFEKNNLSLALEAEENVTIDDFYLAINEALRNMSENIERYDINIQ